MSNFECFVGGVPAGSIFNIDVNDLKDIVDNSIENEIFDFNKSAEIGFIALACYFEAYFKNQFASIINICPSIINNLLNKRPEISINLRDLFVLNFDIYNKVGFLIAEQFDFGTPKAINSLFKDLLLINPFSKEDVEIYNELLSQRNLLVHHGGIYTLKYTKQKLAKENINKDAFYNSLTIKKEDFNNWVGFTSRIVTKTNTACHSALKKYIKDNNIIFNKEQLDSVDSLLWEV